MGDAVDDLFDQAGLTSANSRAADVYTGFGFAEGSPMQTFYIKHQEDGYYSIYNKYTKTVLTVENRSMEANANVIPQEWAGKANQLFMIIRDTEKYRYGAFIVSRHSGMALTIGKHGSVVQKVLNADDKSQVWAFSNRKVWNNSAGFLGVKKLTLAKEYAAVTDDSKTAKWNYIVHPSYKNAYYIMNANSTLFLSSEEIYDKNSILKAYELIQAPYVVGANTLMLFYTVYADDKKEKVVIKEASTRYTLDVDKDTSNLILVPETEISPLAAWEMASEIKE
ncbi:MAG: RICIN domain-containing protein [Melioribacteraceae bacterium]|nr:RICIN domain-containing protein [Melioribacteraceae bacterium]